MGPATQLIGKIKLRKRDFMTDKLKMPNPEVKEMEMSEVKHTATPWRVAFDGTIVDGDLVRDDEESREGVEVWDSTQVCVMNDISSIEKQRVNAALIVLAVNNHEALVDIVRTIVCVCDEGPDHVRELACCEGSPLVDTCRELLTKLGRKAIEETPCQK